MTDLEEYVQATLKDELALVQKNFKNTFPKLTDLEKAIIYWYSENGYESINNVLRNSKGQKQTRLGEFLNLALSKLPNYQDVVFRSTRFSKAHLEKYQAVFEKNEPIIEYAFTSASTSERIARMFGNGIFFEIFSKTGKSVDKISKYGLTSGQNEKEVIFRSPTQFLILDIQYSNQSTHITLQEI